VRRAIDPQDLLARLPICKGLARDAIQRLAASTTRRALARGELLFRQGEPSTGFHIVVYGSIKLSMRGRDGSERVVDIVGAGRTFGEPVVFLRKAYLVSATALSESLVLQLSREAVFHELERNPAFARRIIETLSERAESLVRQLETQAAGSAAQRFVAWLLRRQPPDAEGEVRITLPAAKSAVASQLNLSAEHFSRVLRELVASKLIEMRGRDLHIPDLGRLRAWAAGKEAT
jgi:CRP-like cAMP-binding protein